MPLPPRSGNYTAAGIRDAGNVPHFPDGPRQDLKPVEITQPEGASFTVDGHEVRWQKWRFQVGFTPREGLVLHLVGYEDKGTPPADHLPCLARGNVHPLRRPAARRNTARTSSTWVNTASACSPTAWNWAATAWARSTTSTPTSTTTTVSPLLIKNAICMHEEDHGILWKHADWRTGKTEVRRSRRLVISMIATVGNYEYGYYWYLYQDGTIEYEVKLTGVISNGALPEGEKPAYGTLVAPQVYGPNHQQSSACGWT